MSFTRITNADLVNKGVTSLPDTPDMAASELKQRFDSLGNLCVQKINAIVDELEAEMASLSLGASIPEGCGATQKKVQDILNALNTIVQQNAGDRHNHANKAVLDTITAEGINNYDQTALKFEDIRSVESAVHNKDDEIPTSAAVIRYINSRLGG